MMNDTVKEILRNPNAGAQLLRTDLRLFIKVFFEYITGKKFIFKPFHLRVVAALEKKVFENDGRNLAINIPVRFGKSEIMKYFTAWTYAINPMCNEIYTSYSDELVLNFSDSIKNIIESDLYYKLFGLKLSKSSKSKSFWKIKGGGEMRATSLGGGITGFGAGVDSSQYGGGIKIDDPLKPADARSVVKRQAVVRYLIDTLESRKNNDNVPIILIMQRLCVGDLVDWIKENQPDKWDFLVIPAMDENDESIWPEKKSTEVLRAMRSSVAEASVYASQYNQNPVLEGGNLIKTEWFGRYQTAPRDFESVFIIADTAFTAKKANDFSAFLLCGIKERILWILDGYCKRVEFPDLRRDVKIFWQNAKNFTHVSVSSIDIENKASGQSLIQQLRSDGLPVSELYPTYSSSVARRELVADKYTRFQEVAADLESGYVRIPDGAPWIGEFLAQCEAFTGGKQDEHDDYVDCLMYALKRRRKFIRPVDSEPVYSAMRY